MTYTAHIVAMIVAPKGQPLYSEQATRIEIQDDAAGPYIEVSQEDGKVRIDPAEWPELRDAIETMIAAAAKIAEEA